MSFVRRIVIDSRDNKFLLLADFLRLRELLEDDSRRLREYIDMIEVLSENHELKYYVKEAERMLAQRMVSQGKYYFLSRPRRFGKSLFSIPDHS